MDEEKEKSGTAETTPVKKLYRDIDDAVIAGVAKGIAVYFSIDPVVVRVLFVILAFFEGIGIIIYLIVWIMVPGAITPEQKESMKGKPVRLQYITDNIKKNLKAAHNFIKR